MIQSKIIFSIYSCFSFEQKINSYTTFWLVSHCLLFSTLLTLNYPNSLKLTLNLPKAVPIPNIGVSKGTTQQQTIMMSGGGNVTRVVIPKWLNVTVAPPSGSHTNVVAVSPTKQTQNIII